MNKLTATYEANDQIVSYRGIYQNGEDKFRVSLRRDSYEVQCHARVDVLHASGWLNLIDLVGAEVAALLTAPIAPPAFKRAMRKAEVEAVASAIAKDAARAWIA